MPRKGLRWELVALSAVITLAVLSLAYFSYESVGIRRPLEKALLMDPDVGAVRLSSDKGKDVVEVTLSRVPDLSVSYKRIQALVQDRVGQGSFALEIRDQRDATLQEIYYRIHYYLEEACARGNFGTMIEACKPVLESSDATDYKITVDQDHIYVQIELGDRYLYQVLDRSSAARGGGATQ